MTVKQNNSLKKNKFIPRFIVPLAIIAMGLVLLHSYLNSDNFRANVKNILTGRLESILDKKIEIASIDSISLHSIHLTGLKILENDKDEREILFQSEEAEIKFFIFLPLLQEREKWRLNIKEITFIEANTALSRDSEGDFDLAKKFQLDLESLHENITIEQISFKNSLLVYKDESVYHKDYITVETKDLNGSFDLTHLPEVKFEMRAIQVPDEALLSLSGFFFVGKTEYSLGFHLQDADVTHFQYYLEVAEQFNISKGKFDLELNLSHSPEWDSDVLFWQGEATFYEATIRPYLLKEIPFQQISGSVNFSKPEITISNLAGLHYGRPVLLKGQVRTAPEVSYSLNIEGKQLDASLLKDDISLFTSGNYDFSLEGEVDVWGNIDGLIDAFSFQGKLTSSEMVIEKTPFSTISGNFILNNDGLAISELKSQEPNGSILINGELDWSTDLPSYRFIVNTSNLSLHHSLFKQFSALQEFSGNMESQFQIESGGEGISNTELNWTFSIKDMRRGDTSLPAPLAGNLRATIDFTDNIMSIEELKLFSGEGNGSLQGDIRFEELISFMLDFKYQIPDLAIYSNLLQPELQISGNMALQGKAAGDIRQPGVTLDFNFSEFSIQDHRAEELTGKLVYEKDILSIESFILNNQDLRLAAEGKIIFSPTAQTEINISYQLSSLAINPLLEIMDYQIPLSGFIDGNGDVQGIWPDLKAKGVFQLEEIIYQDYPLGQGEINFNLEPNLTTIFDTDNQTRNIDNFLSRIGQHYSLDLEHFQLQNEMIELSAKGKVKMGEGLPFSLDIEFSHQEFNEMVEHFYPQGESINRFLPSRITGKVACNGNINEQNILFTSLLIPEQGENNTASRLEAVLTINKDGLGISGFQLIQSEGSLKAEGMIASDRSIDINFQANQLDLANLIASLAIDEEIEGIMDIEGLCSGTLEQPTISIIVKIEEGNFREFKFENLSSELIWNSLINLVAIKELNIILEKEYHITARGNIPVRSLVNTIGEDIDSTSSYSEIPLDFHINMDKVGLNLLKVFWKDAFSEITGIADLEIYLTGTAGNPLINGTVGVYQGIAHLAGFPVEIGEINNTINIINNRVTIPAIPFIAYENRFSFSGGLELVRFLPDNLSLIIKNEDGRIIYQNILESEVDLGLVISNSILSPQISGQVILSDGTLNVNNLLEFEEGIHFASSPSLLGNNSTEQLNVNIELAEPFKLKMSDAEIDISGKIVLNGSLLKPVPSGTLALKKGYFIYFDKRFSVLDGMVTINGMNPDNIELNARANTHVQGIQINISILGNLLNPQILLSSQPALKETEILSLLAFDRNIEGLSEGEINQLLSQEMVNIIFQSLQINLFRRFEREIAEGLDLEFLRISFNNHRNDDSYFFLEDLHLSDLTLEVGKSIGDDLLITYSTPLDFHGEASLTLDYQLSPGFTFSTQLENISLREEDYKIKFGLEFRF